MKKILVLLVVAWAGLLVSAAPALGDRHSGRSYRSERHTPAADNSATLDSGHRSVQDDQPTAAPEPASKSTPTPATTAKPVAAIASAPATKVASTNQPEPAATPSIDSASTTPAAPPANEIKTTPVSSVTSSTAPATSQTFYSQLAKPALSQTMVDKLRMVAVVLVGIGSISYAASLGLARASQPLRSAAYRHQPSFGREGAL